MQLGMDKLDTDIVTLLRHDSRSSVSAIAASLRVSRTTIQARLKRLEARGDIVGYTVVLRADAVQAPVRGLSFIEVAGRQADKVIAAFRSFAEIGAVHTTNGKWDLIIELSADSLSGFDAVLRRVRMVEGVTGSETHLLLATPRSTHARL